MIRGLRKNQKLLVLLGLYLAQSIPMAFFSTIIPVMMRQASFSLTSIGLIQLFKLPWILKFIWAPTVDNQCRTVNSLRSMIMTTESLYAFIILIIAFLHIDVNFYFVFTLIVISFFISATQDIAVDRYAILILKKEERSMGNSMQSAGNFLGTLFGMGVLLVLYHYIGWLFELILVAVLVIVALVPLVLYREDKIIEVKPHQEKVTIRDIASFFMQPKSIRFVLMLLLYYTTVIGFMTMMKPMLVDYGYSFQQIGLLMGVGGSAVAAVIAFGSGYIIKRIGLNVPLYVYQCIACVSAICFALLLPLHKQWVLITFGVLLPWAIYGAMSVGIYTYGMNCVRKGREATDFTLMIVITHLGSILMATLSGIISQHFGYIGLAYVEMFLAIVTVYIIYINRKKLV